MGWAGTERIVWTGDAECEATQERLCSLAASSSGQLGAGAPHVWGASRRAAWTNVASCFGGGGAKCGVPAGAQPGQTLHP
eukprot:47657-Chlamydomonas_euryale.AAC.1